MPGEETSPRRMTLRQLLAQAEKCSRDLSEQLSNALLNNLEEAREMSRPVRKRSSYPSMLALMNSLQRLESVEAEVDVLVEYLLEQLEQIRQHARREQYR